jgi:dihydroflavonol-4-reductase
MAKVLVTGGTGFVGSHAIIALIKAGHTVHATVRDLRRKTDILSVLRSENVNAERKIEVFACDLTNDMGWAEAVRGCDFVLHIASPFPSGPVKDENDLIVPAREGALRVLRFARDANVKRVVMTSSFAAIGYGYPEKVRTFTEADWTQTDSKIAPYIKSKAVAERAAWDFIRVEGGPLELTTICPTGIFGPVLSSDLSSSIEIVRGMLKGQMPACPKLYFGIVDVRDVVDLHVAAMTSPLAKGERFIATSGGAYSLFDVAKVLRNNLGDDAKLAPKWELPSWFVQMAAKITPKFKGFLNDLDIKRTPSNQKTIDVFSWEFRSMEQSITDTGRSLVTRGLTNS